MPKNALNLILFSLLIILIFIAPGIVLANVVINEIAWAGTTEDWRYEWVELFNGSGGAIDVSGWQIENGASSNKSLVLNAGIIPSNGYFLICRKEMTGCDVVETKLSLHNEYDKNGKLALKDGSGSIIDSTPIPKDKVWPGGDNETKQTMEKIISGWQTSQNPNGTPKTANSAVNAPEAEPEPLVMPEPPAQSDVQEETAPVNPEPITDNQLLINNKTTPTELEPDDNQLLINDNSENNTSTPPPTLPKIEYPSNIFINEILPSPKGADSEMEWLELKNTNNYEVNITDWKIQDTIGAIKTYTFPQGTKISGNGFLLLKRPTTKITLQNSGDGLNLIQPDGNIIYNITYGKAPQGQSYNQTNEMWDWSTTLTPGQTNIITQPMLTEANSQEKSTTQIKQDNTTISDNIQQKTLANINQELPKTSSRLLTFIFAFIIAIGSAVIVLFLKKKFKTEDSL